MKLVVGNSECSLISFPINQLRLLKETLSYTVTSFNSKKWRSAKKTLLGKDGVFPTGLLPLVTQALDATQFELLDNRRTPEGRHGTFTLSPTLTPYPEQIDAVKAAVRHHRGVVVMPTGTGKTLTMALLIQALQVRTLIVVPNLSLKLQLKQTFKSLFGETNNIVIENIDSSSLDSHKDFDCLIIDEAHHVAAKTYRKLNKRTWGGIYYRFFFTATPFRSKDEEQILMESIAGKVLYRLPYATAVDNGLIVPVEAYYITVPRTRVVGNSTKWASVYNELVVNNEVRNKLLQELLVTFHVNKLSTICLVKEIKHGESLTSDGAFNFIKGENDNNVQLLKAFNDRKFNVVIGTSGVLGEGVDTKPAEFVIVAGLGKSKNQFMQMVGRGVRRFKDKESCKIIIFKDSSHRWTISHFKEQCKILKEEYGVIPSELQLFV